MLFIAFPIVEVLAAEPEGAPEAADPQATTAAPDSAPPAVKFDIWEFEVVGNSVLDATDIERTVYPFLGEGKTVDDVFAAEAALNDLYREKGYVTVQVFTPEQEVNDGLVRFEVLEAPVGRNRVVGSKYHDLDRVRESVPSLAPGEVPHLPTFREEIGKLNRRASDRAVAATLEAGIRPGTVDADLQVEDRLPLHGSAEINDQYSRNTTRLRSVFSLSYANLWQREHTFGFSYQGSPEEVGQVSVWSLNYSLPYGEKNTLFAYMVDSSSDVSVFSSTGGVGILGAGRVYGGRWIRLLPQTGPLYNSLTFGLDYKDFADVVAPDAGDPLETPITYFKGTISYAGLMLDTEPEVRFGLDANFGFRGAVSSEQEFADKRFLSDPNFFYLTGRLSLTQPVTAEQDVFFRFNGQLTEDALVSNEQLALGGVNSVRGYLVSQVLVDYGFDTSLQYRYRPVALAQALPEWFGIPEFSVFTDAGVGKIHERLPGTDETSHLASAGFGVETSARSGLVSSIYLAWPFITNGEVTEGSTRVHFRVGMQF